MTAPLYAVGMWAPILAQCQQTPPWLDPVSLVLAHQGDFTLFTRATEGAVNHAPTGLSSHLPFRVPNRLQSGGVGWDLQSLIISCWDTVDQGAALMGTCITHKGQVEPGILLALSSGGGGGGILHRRRSQPLPKRSGMRGGASSEINYHPLQWTQNTS